MNNKKNLNLISLKNFGIFSPDISIVFSKAHFSSRRVRFHSHVVACHVGRSSVLLHWCRPANGEPRPCRDKDADDTIAETPKKSTVGGALACWGPEEDWCALTLHGSARHLCNPRTKRPARSRAIAFPPLFSLKGSNGLAFLPQVHPQWRAQFRDRQMEDAG